MEGWQSWSMALVLKTSNGVSRSGVRIPPPPPEFYPAEFVSIWKDGPNSAGNVIFSFYSNSPATWKACTVWERRLKLSPLGSVQNFSHFA